MYYYQHAKIDFEKVKTLEDVLRILKALEIAFELNNPNLKEIEDLVKIEDKKPYTFY
jgi:hypothetical protein